MRLFGQLKSMETAVIGTIVSTLAILAVVNWQVNKKLNDLGGCPECDTPLPLYRKATSWRQAFWGGWTCKNCGSELDRKGQLLIES